jgi:hypothetical protein
MLSVRLNLRKRFGDAMKNAHRPGRRIRQALISVQIGLLVALVPCASFARDDSSDAFAIGFDLVVLRTLGSVKLAVGTVALVPASILYILKMPFDGGDTGALQEVAEVLVVEPANYVFRRPLGEDFAGG